MNSNKKIKDSLVWSRLFGDIWEAKLSDLSTEAFEELVDFFEKGKLDGNLGGVSIELDKKAKTLRIYGCSQHNKFEINSLKLLLSAFLRRLARKEWEKKDDD